MSADNEKHPGGNRGAGESGASRGDAGQHLNAHVCETQAARRVIHSPPRAWEAPNRSELGIGKRVRP